MTRPCIRISTNTNTISEDRGFQGGYGPGHRAANPSAYDEYLKAYSVAMLPGRERENVSYGGKSACYASHLSLLRYSSITILPDYSYHATIGTRTSYIT